MCLQEKKKEGKLEEEAEEGAGSIEVCACLCECMCVSAWVCVCVIALWCWHSLLTAQTRVTIGDHRQLSSPCAISIVSNQYAARPHVYRHVNTCCRWTLLLSICIVIAINMIMIIISSSLRSLATKQWVTSCLAQSSITIQHIAMGVTLLFCTPGWVSCTTTNN